VKSKIDRVGMLCRTGEARKVSITVREVARLKKLFDGKLVVSVKDKNVGQLRVECPLRLYERLKKEIYDCKVFIKVGIKYNDVLRKFDNIFYENDMIKIGRWNNGRIPENYTLPKQKDPIHKARLISSYFSHPLKYVYKNISTILTWLFNSVKFMYDIS